MDFQDFGRLMEYYSEYYSNITPYIKNEAIPNW
jgi:hypothetical protein